MLRLKRSFSNEPRPKVPARRRNVVNGAAAVVLVIGLLWACGPSPDVPGPTPDASGPGLAQSRSDPDGAPAIAGDPADGEGDAERAPLDSARRAAADLEAALRDDPLVLIRRQPPERDLARLAIRLGRLEPTLREPPPRTISEPRPERSVGDREQFWVHDIVGDRYFEITATLEVITDHAYFWVQDDQTFDAEALQRGAETFDDQIYPTLRRALGEEWSPGVDLDPRVHVLHHEPTPGIAGFFSSADEFTKAVEPYSNEREMFYINVSTYVPGSLDYNQLLAHEYQHMIHWHQDRGEPVWSNEGLSELAPYLVGFGRQTGGALISTPDTQLTRWEATGSGNSAHYAASFLYFAWLWNRYGDGILRSIVSSPGNGEVGVEEAIQAEGDRATFDETFLDWTVANLLGDPDATVTVERPIDFATGSPAAGDGGAEIIRDGRYGYRDVSVGRVTPRPLPDLGADSDVHQFGADYWNATEAVRDGRLALRFEGSPVVDLLADGGNTGGISRGDDTPAAPPNGSGGRVWWSNRGDDMDSRLTRTFDLSGVEAARLDFRLWYDIEENWDYAYILASTDGQRWKMLRGTHTTERNPNGNNYGAGYTGSSAGWVDESVDLTPYAGDEMMLRFEMITDDAVALSGMAVDDLRIDAIGFAEDLDAAPRGPSGEWVQAGWLPIDPALPQRWGLQMVIRTEDEVRLRRMAVPATGTTDLVVDDVPGDATVVVIVSGMTHATRSVAAYRLFESATGTPPPGYP